MSWKKNIVSYILWSVYAAGAVFLSANISYRAACQWGWDAVPAAVAAAVMFLAAAAVFGIFRGVVNCNLFKKGGVQLSWKLIEASAVCGLIVSGFLVRAANIQYAGEAAAYYDAAKIVEGSPVPQLAHGAVYFYLQLLHALFFVVGNKWMAGIWLQMILKMIGIVLMYAAVRKMAGVCPAVIMSAFLMFSPKMITAGITYSPDIMYQCIFAVGLLAAAGCLQKCADGRAVSIYDLLLTGFAGIVLGLACYLDISGVSLLGTAVSILWLNRRENGKIWGNVSLQSAVLIVSTVLFFGLDLLLDAFASSKSFGAVLRAWQGLYLVKAEPQLRFTGYGDVWLYLILFGMMLLGVFSYWCRKGAEKLSPWILMAVCLYLFNCFQMTSEHMSADYLLFMIYSILAGTGFAECFLRRIQKEPETLLSTLPDIEEIEFDQTEKEIEMEAELLVNEEKQIQYIENPLPMPKKHVKKKMDYGLEPQSNKMDYDIEVSDDDDFDI